MGGSVISVSGTVTVTLTVGGSSSLPSSLTGVVSISVILSSFTSTSLPYSFSITSWNSLFFSSLAAVRIYEKQDVKVII